jgi:hypothetical protein
MNLCLADTGWRTLTQNIRKSLDSADFAVGAHHHRMRATMCPVPGHPQPASIACETVRTKISCGLCTGPKSDCDFDDILKRCATARRHCRIGSLEQTRQCRT